MTSKPWISGPKELIDHAIGHLRQGGAFDHRIAMISIDNAVELAIKTYLGLPKRVRGSDGPSRQQLQAATNSFPNLLDLLEEYGEDKLDGVELGDIEVYHRLRNQLYHDGNGVTVDSDHVDGYLQIARILLSNLLGVVTDNDTDKQISANPTTLVGQLVERWGTLEREARALAAKYLSKEKTLRRPVTSIIDGLVAKNIVDGGFRSRLNRIAQARNEIVHGMSVPSAEELGPIVDELEALLKELPRMPQ